MPHPSSPPSPDNRKVEHLLRTQVGRLITDLFDSWDDTFKAPEIMREDGQAAITRFRDLVTEAAIARNLIPDLANPHGRKGA